MSSAEPAAPSGPASPPPPAWAQGLVCAACGYSLAGVSDDGRCPECGLSVAASRRGDSLLFANADWRSQVQTGAGMVSIAPAIACVVIVGGLLWAGFGVLIGADSTSAPEWLLSGVGVVATGLGVRGWWLMTFDEPDAPVSARSHVLCLMLRATSIGFFVVFALVWLAGRALGWAGALTTRDLVLRGSIVPLGLIGLTHLVAAMLFASLLAARVPNPRMAREFGRSAWVFLVAGVWEGGHRATGWSPSTLTAQGGMGMLVGGPLVLLSFLTSILVAASPFWYWLTCVWLWRNLKRIRGEVTARDAAVEQPAAQAEPASPEQ